MIQVSAYGPMGWAVESGTVGAKTAKPWQVVRRPALGLGMRRFLSDNLEKNKWRSKIFRMESTDASRMLRERAREADAVGHRPAHRIQQRKSPSQPNGNEESHAGMFPAEETLTRFRTHSGPLRTRSDRRSLWMACLGVAFCEKSPTRRMEAIHLAKKWMEEQPARAHMFRQWIDLLQAQETLETVLQPTADNQELRSVCPLAGSIRPKEHRAALRYFQKNIPLPR